MEKRSLLGHALSGRSFNGVGIPGQSGHTVFTRRGEVLDAVTDPEPEQEISLIVTFNGPPGPDSVLQKTERETFRRHLAQAGLKSSTEFEHDFRVVLNAVVVRAPWRERRSIAALPGVRAVDLDAHVTAMSGGAGAGSHDRVAPSPAALSGKGVVIAIIDTGIDYLHADLGGGIGEGFRVVGGWDFVNDDNNPMDDDGHGTLVAGVAAADGSEPGLAPQAELLAVKVLDEHGFGRFSNVIAGIEYALDPDGDPTTDDAADVLNLSLGRPDGGVNSPIARAVAAAVELGAVVVVASGNHGPDWMTTANPGLVQSAITVGASEGNGVAAFSGRGPVLVPELHDKPDLVAPGVGVRSTSLGGGYDSANGTSLSAPAVSGAAALLIQGNPHWTPSQVKSALCNSATDLGLPVWDQGSGKLNIASALAAKITSDQVALNLGQVDLDQAIYDTHREFQLTNHGPTTVSLHIEEPREIPGATLGIEPRQLTLTPGESKTVRVSVVVADRWASFPDLPIPSYHWTLRITGDENLVMPLSIIRSPELKLSSELDGHVFIHNQTGDRWWVRTLGGEESLFVPPGDYEIRATLRNEFFERVMIFAESYRAMGQHAIQLTADDATHRINLDFLDRRGRPLHHVDWMAQEVIEHRPSGLGSWTHSWGQALPTKYLSDLSKTYMFDAVHVFTHWGVHNNVHVVPVALRGVHDSVFVEVAPRDYRTLLIRFDGSPGPVLPTWWVTDVLQDDPYYWYYSAWVFDDYLMLDPNQTLRIHMAPRPADFLWPYSAFAFEGVQGAALTTALIRYVEGGSVELFAHPFDGKPIETSDATRVPLTLREDEWWPGPGIW